MPKLPPHPAAQTPSPAEQEPWPPPVVPLEIRQQAVDRDAPQDRRESAEPPPDSQHPKPATASAPAPPSGRRQTLPGRSVPRPEWLDRKSKYVPARSGSALPKDIFRPTREAPPRPATVLQPLQLPSRSRRSQPPLSEGACHTSRDRSPSPQSIFPPRPALPPASAAPSHQAATPHDLPPPDAAHALHSRLLQATCRQEGPHKSKVVLRVPSSFWSVAAMPRNLV